MGTEPIFVETQRFRQPVLWIAVVPVLLIPGLIFGYGMVQQLMWKEPWGGAGTTDPFLVVVGTLAIMFTASVVLLLVIARMTVEVNEAELTIDFHPFVTDIYALTRIVSFNVVAYRPLRDVRGRGIRKMEKGRAYTVSGRQGVLIVLADGRRLLIGSGMPEKLHHALSPAPIQQ